MSIAKTVADVMTTRVITLSEEDSLEAIAEGMDNYRLRHLLVVDGSRLVGLISQRDLLRLTVSSLEGGAAQARDTMMKRSHFVGEVMTRNPRTVRADTPLKEAVALMVANKFGCLPVVDDQQCVIGIVTKHDLLELLGNLLP